MPPITLGVYQSRSLPTLKETLHSLSKIAYLASKNKIDLLLFPEAFLGGYPRGSSFDALVGSRTTVGREEFANYVEQCPDFGDSSHSGPGAVEEGKGDGTREELERIARDTGVFLVVGCVERCGGTLYCGVVYVDPGRGLVGKRRKLMPTGSERLIWGFGSPSTLQPIKATLNGQELTLGAAICWENYMPLLRYTLYSQNVQIYLAPTADGRESWISTMRHIAMEGRCFVLGANQFVPSKIEGGAAASGSEKDGIVGGRGTVMDRTSCRGGSVIVDPLGDVVAGPLWDQEGMLKVTVDDVEREVLKGKMDFDVVGHYRGPWKVVRDN